MLRMIFEDSKESAIGKLLSRAYADNANLELHLCGGNGMLQRYLEENYNEKDTYVIYVDVVPDNILTSKVFRKLKKYIRRNCGTNVYLIPIPCMEYFALKVFLQKEFISVREVIETAEYWDKRDVNSIEQYYKYRLDVSEKECCHIGHYCQVTELTGVFYIQSCLCDKGKEECQIYEIEKKSRDLVEALPLFRELVFYSDRFLMRSDPGDICGMCVKAYNEMVDLYTLKQRMNQMQILQFKI